jgi:hypothetical protein
MKTRRKTSAKASHDPVIAEAWKAKDALSRRCAGDVDRFFASVHRSETARRRRESRASTQAA